LYYQRQVRVGLIGIFAKILRITTAVQAKCVEFDLVIDLQLDADMII
jgi:hypothetical protein